jgi:outer membrane receptor for ferrienterochelin and colicins
MLGLSNVEKIEIVEGGMSSLYGSSAIGGVVNIITKKHQYPYWVNFSYLNEDPMVISQALGLGFNYKNFYYSLNFNKQDSDGYDLTPSGDNDVGPLMKTLEEYESSSIKHALKYNISKETSVEFNYSNYLNKIYQYENHIVQVLDVSNPLYLIEIICLDLKMIVME